MVAQEVGSSVPGDQAVLQYQLRVIQYMVLESRDTTRALSIGQLFCVTEIQITHRLLLEI